MAFSYPKWWAEFLDGIAQEIHPSAPQTSREALAALRRRVGECRSSRTRRRFENELDALIESDPFLKPAAEWYLKKRVPKALREAEETLARGQAALAEYYSKRDRKRRKHRD